MGVENDAGRFVCFNNSHGFFVCCRISAASLRLGFEFASSNYRHRDSFNLIVMLASVTDKTSAPIASARVQAASSLSAKMNSEPCSVSTRQRLTRSARFAKREFCRPSEHAQSGNRCLASA